MGLLFTPVSIRFRWDEWIPFSSNRIAPFRTRTVHPAYAPHISPSPVSAVRDAPVTGNDDVRVIMPEVLGKFPSPML